MSACPKAMPIERLAGPGPEVKWKTVARSSQKLKFLTEDLDQISKPDGIEQPIKH